MDVNVGWSLVFVGWVVYESWCFGGYRVEGGAIVGDGCEYLGDSVECVAYVVAECLFGEVAAGKKVVSKGVQGFVA